MKESTLLTNLMIQSKETLTENWQPRNVPANSAQCQLFIIIVTCYCNCFMCTWAEFSIKFRCQITISDAWKWCPRSIGHFFQCCLSGEIKTNPSNFLFFWPKSFSRDFLSFSFPFDPGWLVTWSKFNRAWK